MNRFARMWGTLKWLGKSVWHVLTTCNIKGPGTTVLFALILFWAGLKTGEKRTYEIHRDHHKHKYLMPYLHMGKIVHTRGLWLEVWEEPIPFEKLTPAEQNHIQDQEQIYFERWLEIHGEEAYDTWKENRKKEEKQEPTPRGGVFAMISPKETGIVSLKQSRRLGRQRPVT